MLNKVILCFILLTCINQVKMGKNILKNDKFLDFVDFVPLNLSAYNLNDQFGYGQLLRSKSLNMSDSSILEKKKQKDIVTKLIDSIGFDVAGNHQIGLLKSADQLQPLNIKYNKADLSAYRLEFIGIKLQEKKKFNHYIIKKRLKKKSYDLYNSYNDHLIPNMNNMKTINSDNSLFYNYQNIPILFGHTLLSRNLNSIQQNLFNRNLTNSYLQSKLMNDELGNEQQIVFCSVFVQIDRNFGRRAIRTAFTQSFKRNLNYTSVSSASLFNSIPQNRVNIWLTDGQFEFKTLKPLERINTFIGMGMLYT